MTRQHRISRGVRVVLGSATGVLLLGGGFSVASAIPLQQGALLLAPPTDNVFPVPLPYQVDFEGSWHACRDGCERLHKGTDVMADEGVPLAAVESGTIARLDNVDDGNGGLSVWLRGDSGVAYYYAHNSANLVVEGQRVGQGETIAEVGHTGNARETAPHVHFQVNLCGEVSSDEPCTVDPYPYLVEWDQAPIDGGVAGAAASGRSVAVDGAGGVDGVGWFDAGSGGFEALDGGGSLTDLSAPVVPGGASAAPVAGDWDGDGRDSVGLYHRGDATFRLFDDEGTELEPIVLGEPGREDVWPIAGDFDGDGRDSIGLFRQADATFVPYIDGYGAGPSVVMGSAGGTDFFPVAGDWDGTGRDGLGVYHRSDGVLELLDGTGAAIPMTNAHVRGQAAMPVAGDWDGDGRDTIGVLRSDAAAGGLVFDLPAPGGDREARWVIPIPSGSGALPVAGDWDGPEAAVVTEPAAASLVDPAGRERLEPIPPATSTSLSTQQETVSEPDVSSTANTSTVTPTTTSTTSSTTTTTTTEPSTTTTAPPTGPDPDPPPEP